MRALGIGILASCLLGLPTPLLAQSLSVQASLSSGRVAVGEPLTLEIRATTNGEGDIRIELPNWGWLTERRRSQAESSQFSYNGRSQTLVRERKLLVEFEATRTGSFSMSGITAQLGGVKAMAAPISLEILESTAQLATPARAGEVAPPTPDESQIFVRYRTDKAEAFLGEQVLLDLEIYTAGNFNLDDNKPPPALDGFWREVVEQPNRLEARVANVGGRSYRCYRLWRLALFPLQAGERLIEGTTYTFSSNVGMFSAGQRLSRRVPPITLLVKPLPTEGRPREFVSTNVGDYRFTATVDRQRVPANKAVVLTLRLQGAGNVKNAQIPELPRLDGFRAFPPSLRELPQIGPAGISGSKEAELILMPLRGGRLSIPAFEFVSFSPTKGEYERLSTPEIPIWVDGDPTEAPTAPEAPAAERPDDLSASLRPLRYRSALVSRGPALGQQPLFAALMAGPPVLLLLLVAVDALRRRARADTPAARRRHAAQAAHARLATAQAAADERRATDAYAAIADALTELATERTGVAIRGLTLDEARASLAARGVPSEVIDGLSAELEHCDFARFAPGGRGDDAVRAALTRASEVIARLEALEMKP